MARFLTFRSVHTKMIFFTGVLFTICVGLSTLLSVHLQKRLLLKTKKRDFSVLAETIENSLSHAMLFGRSDEVRNILRHVAKNEEILKLRIFSPSGEILNSALDSEIGKKVEDCVLRAYREKKWCYIERCEGHGVYCSIMREIGNRKECFGCHGKDKKVLGVLHVAVSLAHISGDLRYIYLTSAFSFIFTLSLLAALGIYLQRRFVYLPLKRLEESMERVKNGDLDVVVEVKGEDEIARLGEAFNLMVRELKESKKALESLATIGEFASGIAHEIRNPLAGISSAIQVMLMETGEDDPNREIMEEILKEIDNLEAFVKDILAYARPSEPKKEPVDIKDVIEESIRFIDPTLLSDKEIVKKYGDTPIVSIDPKQMRQVFQNIIVNGLQAMEAGGKLTIETGVKNGYLYVSISDEGVGIPEEELEKIFKPFYSTKDAGTGLGLSIVHRIVEKHGGKIEVESQVGKGTTFIVYIPLNG